MIKEQFLNIRRMSFKDIDIVSKIEKECFKFPWHKSDFFLLHLYPGTISIVYEEEGCIKGYALALPEGKGLHLINIATKPEYRRKGIASSMLLYMIKEAKRINKNKIFLEVRESNLAAINLYKKFGFKNNGIKKRYYQDGENAVIMELEI